MPQFHDREPAHTHAALAPIPKPIIDQAISSAFAEDLGLAGDLTTDAIIKPEWHATGTIAARKPGVVAGLAIAEAAFHYLDPAMTFTPRTTDGAPIRPGDILAEMSGNARALLTAERTALN
ncbi:MAG TPA: hypothetical protein VMX97_04375, partial [Hyphomicrobiaceae bacterium]|nr:hypothetical protein [Hyphomicrobiaceae bacterium]